MYHWKTIIGLAALLGLSTKVRAAGCTFSVDASTCTVSDASQCSFGSYYKSGDYIVQITGTEGEPTCTKLYQLSPGYYVNAADSEKYIKCDGKSSVCEDVEPVSVDCSKGYEGKLVKEISNGQNTGICVSYPKHSGENGSNTEYHLIQFSSGVGSDRYLVNYNKNSIFSFDQDKKITYYAVEVTDNSIVFDSLYGDGITPVDDQCVLYNEGKVINRLEDFCSEHSSGNYYTCVHGKCKSRFWQNYETINENNYSGERTFTCDNGTGVCNVDKDLSGYYLNESVLYKFKSRSGSKVETPETGFYWNNYQYDYVIQCTERGCSKYTPDIATSCEGHAGGIINNNYVLALCPNKDYLPIILSELNKADYVSCKGSNGSPFDNNYDYYILKADDYSLTIDNDSTINEYSEGTLSDEEHYECESGKCTAIGLKALPECTANDCKVSGDDIPENSFCITSNGKIYKKTSNGCTLVYGNSGKVEGIHIFDVNGDPKEVIPGDTGDAWKNSKLVIYDCDNGICSKTSGYVRNLSNFYRIDDKSSIEMINKNSCTSAINTYQYKDFSSGGSEATFQPCIETRITTEGKNNINKFATITINKDKTGLFLNKGVKDGESINRLYKITTYTSILTSKIEAGYYVNAGSIYGSDDVAIGDDALIYCKSNEVNECVTLPALPGYYLNAGEDKDSKPVISCDGRKCKSISVTETECGAGKQVAGGLILTSDRKVKICLDNGSTVEIKSSGSDNDYKSIILNEYTDFPQTGTSTTISVKIGITGSATILETGGLPTCTSQSIFNGQHCILNNQINKKDVSLGLITGTASQTSIVFFNRQYEVITQPETNPTTPADVIAYQCKFAKDTNVESCTLISGYIVSGGTIIQCSGWKGEGCTVTAIGSSESCTSGNGVITANGNKVCFGTGTDNSVSLSSGEVVFLTSDINKIYGRNKNEVIYLKLTNNSALVNSSSLTPGYYLNSAVSTGKSKALIYCTESVCEVRDALNGYYLSSDKLIKCNSTGCSIETVSATSCSKAGNVIINQENKMVCITDSTSHSIGITTEYKSIEVEANDFPGISAKSTITVKFGSDGSAVVMEDASLPICDSSLDTSKSCTSSNAIVSACITSAKKIYITSGGTCNIVTSTEESKYIYFDNNNEEVQSPFTNTSKTIAFAYKCTFTTSDNVNYALDSCKISKGYTIENGNYIQCSGWKYDICTVGSVPSDSGCVEKTDIEIGSSVLLCAHTNEITIPYSPKVDTASLILDEPSSKFGSPSGVVFLSISENEIVVTSNPTVAGYYVNQNYISGKTKQLINCSGSSTSLTCKAEDAKLKTDGFAYLSALDTTGKNIIICGEGQICEIVPGSSAVGNVYIDASQASNDANHASKSLIVCTADEGCKSSIKTSGSYINALDQTEIIKCLSTECKSEAEGNTFSTPDGLDPSNTITWDESKFISGKIIASSCTTVVSDDFCKVSSTGGDVSLPANHYCMSADKKIYLSSKANNANGGKCEQQKDFIIIQKVNDMYKKGTIGTTSSGTIYDCESGSSHVCTQLVSTNYLSDVKKNNKYLYTCDDSGNCEMNNQCEEGSYLTGTAGDGGYSHLIKCKDSNINNCVSVGNGVTGNDVNYYVDLAKKGNVIKCTSEGCVSNPGSTEQGYVYVDKKDDKDDKIIICNSETCHSVSASVNGSYIDAEATKNIITFKSDENGNIIPTITENRTDVYIDATNGNYTIRCSSDKCVSKPECRVNVGNSECKDQTYYRVNVSYILETEPGTESNLFYCLKNNNTGTMDCSEVKEKGYFINSSTSEVISCSDIKHCKSTSTENGCIGIGKFYRKSNNKWAICLNNDKDISAELTTISTSYIMPCGASNPICTGDNSAIVKVSENSVTLVEDYDFQKNYYVYVENKSNKVLVSGSIPEDIQNEPNKLVDEYECSNASPTSCKIVSESE